MKIDPFSLRRAFGLGLLLLACGSLPLHSAQFGLFTYLVSGNTVTITACAQSASGPVVIPAMIGGRPVTRIGDEAFSARTAVTSVSIPSGVTNIGRLAFQSCVSLASVTIPAGVTQIGGGAFFDCQQLAEVTLPTTLKAIPNAAFYRCSQLTRVRLPGGLLTIGDQAFWGSGVTNLELPASVTSIGQETFSYCHKLETITLPDGLQTLNHSAFRKCSSLTQLRIPRALSQLGIAAFSGCTRLAAITAAIDNPNFSSVDGVLHNKSRTFLIAYPGGKAGDYRILDSVREIAQNAFDGSSQLRSLEIPDTVKTLGSAAFQYCTALAIVRVGRGITVLPNNAFAGCSALTQVILPNTLRTIADLVFIDCQSLRSITIPASVRTLGTGLFDGLSSWETDIEQIYFEGNAPQASPQTFFGSNAAGRSHPTVYYLPGATGWQSRFAERPTVLWAPLVAKDASFGVQQGEFGFAITGANGMGVALEAAEDLSLPVWMPVSTVTLVNGSARFVDPDWQEHSNRFYRLRMP